MKIFMLTTETFFVPCWCKIG